MKKIVVIIIVVVLVAFAAVCATLGGVYAYLVNGDELTIEHFFTRDLPNLREYGTSDLVKIQDVQDERRQEEFENGEYTQENPYIVENPYGRNVLSAFIQIPTEDAVSYEYTVKGKDENVDFTYSDDEFVQNPILPVAGLYYKTENTVEVTLTNEAGDKTELEYNITIEETDEIKDIPSDGAEINVKDEEAFDTVLNSNYFLDAGGNGYDSNGDLRFSGLYNYRNTLMKVLNGKFYVGVASEQYVSDEYYAPRFYEMDFMGHLNPDTIIEAPEGYGFHHDVAYSEEFNMYYALTSQKEGAESFSEEEYGESGIAYYDADTYKLVDHYSLTDLIDDTIKVGSGTAEYDLHINSIDVIEERNELLLNSRSASITFGLDIDTHEITWIIGEKELLPEDLQDLVLEPTGDNMTFQHGAHSAFEQKDVPAYQEYYDDGKIVISLLDNNNKAVNENGEIIYNELNMQESANEAIAPADLDLNALLAQADTEEPSRVITYAIDPENMTVELVNVFDTLKYSAYTSATTVVHDVYQLYSLGVGVMGITDLDGKSLVEITGITGGYRANIYTPEQIKGTRQ